MVLIDSKRPFIMLSVAVALMLFIVVIYQQYQKNEERGIITIYTGAGPVKIRVEYAQTPEKQKQGLMRRASISKNYGMLFIFPNEERQSFWMKDTLLPLDLLFISSKGDINEITSLLPCPPETFNCPVYESKNPARFVLEVNAGFAERNKIIESDILEISGF